MKHPEKMRQRRETVEHPFGTIKARIGATHYPGKLGVVEEGAIADLAGC